MATHTDYRETEGQYQWWTAGKDDNKLAILNTALSKIHADNTTLESRQQYYWQLYRNQLVYSNAVYDYSTYLVGNEEQETMTLNVVKSIIDTAVSKIAANKPRPRFLTSGGSWSDFEKSKKLTKFMDGQFYHTKLYEMAPQAFLDACIFGTGVLKIYEENLDIKIEKVLVQELMIAKEEAVYGEPQTIHQVKKINREVLKNMWPEHKEMIDKVRGSGSDTQMIDVRMSWKKAEEVINRIDGKKRLVKIPGNYVVSVETVILEDIDYHKTYFPFVLFKWTDLTIGYLGAGLAEELSEIQLELNDLLGIAQDSIHQCELPKILVEENSNVNVLDFDDEVGTVITYRGTQPQYIPAGGTSQVVLNQIENLYRKAYEITGISRLSAQSAKPSGLDSGVALREFNDIESERFYNVEKRYEQCFVDAGKMMIDLIKDILEDAPHYSVKVAGKDFLDTVKFKDVNLSDDRYKMEIFSASFLPRTPAGRLAKVQELIGNGFLGLEEGLELLEYPDVEGAVALQNADFNLIKYMIDMMAFKGKYVAPEPYFNLELGMKWVQKAYMEFKMKGLPEDRQALFRRWLDDALALLTPPDTSIVDETQQAIEQDAQAQALEEQSATQAELDNLLPIEG